MDPLLRARAIRIGAWLAVIAVIAFAAPVTVFTVTPFGCISCHEEQGADGGVANVAHEGVECASCHVGAGVPDRVRWAYYQAFGMVVPVVSTSDTPVSRVSDAECIACHEDLSGVVESRGLRIRHRACAEGSTCTSCHSTVAHLESVTWSRTYAMERCLDCHSTKEVSRACESCHAGRIDRDLPGSGTFPVTHGPNWRQTHGMGQMSTCSACHTSDDFCQRCHGPGVPHTPRFVTVHGRIAGEPDAGCLGCHESTFCDGCHVYELPHPVEFTKEHSEIVERDGDAHCSFCHDRTIDCVACHELHVHPGGAGPLPSVRPGRPQ